ncbi:50S ribosomal protein L3 [Buchnera aphidicola (Mindarus keteleerifoliae)]|uniref:50S ribosomal protein L3 n=1 Tax=Buchnera aphidicola TaxID=9 RepID=UPI0031B6F603
MIGLVGRKVGMTRIFSEDGRSIPVTVIEVKKNFITQIKYEKRDSYNAIQVTTGTKKSSKLTKSEIGNFISSGVKAGRGLWEFRTEKNVSYKIGEFFTAEILKNVSKVDITGYSKGKGFTGTIKRWNFRMQDASHGNSLSHRAPGSIGQNQTPGRVFKGKKMAGHSGDHRTTIQSLKIIKIDEKENLILIKGSVPGSIGSDLIIKPAVKEKRRV